MLSRYKFTHKLNLNIGSRVWNVSVWEYFLLIVSRINHVSKNIVQRRIFKFDIIPSSNLK